MRKVVFALAVLMTAALATITSAEPHVYLPFVFKQAAPTPISTNTPTPTATPSATPTVPTTPAVVVLSHCWWRDNGCAFYVWGEVRNDTGQAVDVVKITANGRDSHERLVWTAWTYGMIAVVGPGELSPFRLLAPSSNVPSSLDHLDFVVEWDFAGGTHHGQELTVLSYDLVDHGSYLECTGEARNDTARVVEYPEAIITLYVYTGAAKTVVGADSADASPDTVQPGQTCTFSIAISDVCHAPETWVVRVVSDYYDW